MTINPIQDDAAVAPVSGGDERAEQAKPAHFLHIGKTGGTSIKSAIRQMPGFKPRGPIRLHQHRFTLADVPEGHPFFFCIRDPISRFISGFYSRLHKGQPRYYFEWTPREELAFAIFQTPQALATALAEGNVEERRSARRALRTIRHVRQPIAHTLGGEAGLLARLPDVLYIARQETLADDWPKLRAALRLPDDVALPVDPERAHRGDQSFDRTLNERQRKALAKWYAEDYQLIELCERIRKERGWA